MAEVRPQGDAGGEMRARVRETVLDVVLEQGFQQTTLEEVLARADCDRDSFERHFSDLEQCVAEMFTDYSEDFIRSVEAAYAAEAEWRDGLRAGAYAALRWARAHPRELRFGVIESLSAGDMVRVQLDNAYARFTDLIDAGRQELDDPDSVPRSTAEGIVGTIVTLLTRWLMEGGGTEGAEDFPDAYAQQLLYMGVLPYLGQEAAEEELEIPPPRD